ncbi:Hypp7790 [Branchiostoma lanceolatum]|uniref:Hypp7790 protein n=1 Tax=Branchiostoma lanceolatum TaxID=7740 RepID=A0A8J9Z461_BRALA|nr:Hypp7790 [Branchiostoma lanceolatum]
MAFSWMLFCSLMVVIAGTPVSGSPSNGSDKIECFATVEMVRAYLMKDSTQQFVSSALKKGCLSVYSKDKDVSDIHAFCDQGVKVAMSDINDFANSKLQPKEICHLRNYTDNEVNKEIQLDSFGDVVCRTAVSFFGYVLENHGGLIANATGGICNYIPLPSFQSPCKDLVSQFMMQLFKGIQEDVCPIALCNAILGN